MPPDLRSGETPGPPAPAGRADHVRNRARILATAHELFARRPIADVGFDDIAEAAGVSRATLFRHTGGKDALIEEIYRQRVTDVNRLVVAALRFGDPWAGFEFLLRRVARWMHEDRGLYEYTRSLQAQGDGGPLIEGMVAAMDQVLERARAAGQLQPFLRVSDLIPLLAFTAAVDSGRQEDFVAALLRGLRA